MVNQSLYLSLLKTDLVILGHLLFNLNFISILDSTKNSAEILVGTALNL